jgi:ribosomal protein L11 methyltransferase
MPTYSALTTLTGEAPAQGLAAAIERMDPEPVGVGVFEVEDGSGLWEVGAYFLDPPASATLDMLAMAFEARPFAVSEVPDIDWVAKVRRELSPVEAGRFFVYGAHDRQLLPAGRIGLEIEATVAFGTGHHGTTLGCLRALDRLLDAGLGPANVADIGCGTAVLAMAAASALPDARVLACDIDAVAVEVALVNVAVNGLAGRVQCIEAAGFDHPDIAARAPFDLVFANILKGPLIALAPAMAAHVMPGGMLILSGLLVLQAVSIIEAYLLAGFNLQSQDDIGEWSTLCMVRV